MSKTDQTVEIEYEGEGVDVTAIIRPIGRGSHVWRGEYGIGTDAGLDGPYDLGQGTEDELRARLADIAADAGADTQTVG